MVHLLFLLLLLVCSVRCMNNQVGTVGSLIPESYIECLKEIERCSEIKEDEVVAWNSRGRWFWALVTLVPDEKTWHGMVTIKPGEDKFRTSNATNFKSCVRKFEIKKP